MSGTNGTTVGTIDLSLIPPPDVVEPLDYEALLRKMLDRLAANDPSFAEVLESDPAAKLLEAVAYARLLDRQRVNEAAKAVMLPHALGADLDNLAALWEVARLQVGTTAQGVAIMEDDDRFRRRVRLAAEGRGAAGSPGTYVYWALTLAPTAADASASQIAPGAVWVAVLGPAADGQPPATELDDIRAAFADEWTSKRPLTDAVTVAPAIVVPYAIDADVRLLPGPDAALVMGRVNAAVDELLVKHRRLGMDMPRSALLAAMHQAGVARVDMAQPAADVVVTAREVALPASRAIRMAGRAF